MISRLSLKDIAWSYLAQFLNIGSGIIIIPLAVKYLSSEDMGLWYLFIAMAGLAQLLEFGFQPTISRMVSYVYSGAKNLKAEGVPESSEKINYQLLYDLINASKWIYRYVALGVAFILLCLGTFYLSQFEEFKRDQVISWLIFSIATVFNFYFTYFNGLIIGKGSQSVLYRITATSKLLMLFTSIPLLVYNYGLISMALGTLVSLVFTRSLLYIHFNDMKKKDIRALSKIQSVKSSQVGTVWRSAWKLGVTSLGAFLILRANQFISSSYLGLNVAGSYGLTIQLIGILSSVSSMYFMLNIPKITSLQSDKNKSEMISIVRKSYFVVNFVYIFGCLAIVFIGLPILDYLDANTKLVSLSLLLIMFFMYALELNHSISATFLTTLNQVPFLYASLVSGFSVVAISLLVVNFTTFGILGIVFGQFFVQALYNNWYWPLRVWMFLRNETQN